MELNVGIIKELIASLGASAVDAIKIETDEFKLTIERHSQTQDSGKSAPEVEINTVAVATPAQPSKQPQEPQNPEISKGTVLKSPIVGIFYASASADKPSFTKVGQQVKTGDTLYIVESMKLMNEIASECDGTVAEIYAQNGQTVEYGQPIMRIE